MYFCTFHFHIISQFTSEFYVTLQLLNAYIPHKSNYVVVV